MKFVLFYHSLISDWNHGNAHFLRGVATELQLRGHEVVVFEPRNSWSLERLVRDHGFAPIRDFYKVYPHLSSVRYDPDEYDIDRMLDGADVVIVHEWNERSLVRRIGLHRKRNPSYRLFFHDTHHRSATAPETMASYDLSNYDGVLAYGAIIRELYLANGWAERAWTWHEAADTRIFHPFEDTNQQRDIVWIGNWGDEERTLELHKFLLEPVRQLGLRACIHGVRFPEGALQALDEAGMTYGGWLANYYVPREFARSRLTVHIPRRPYVEKLPGIPTIRPFEALACGIPLICSPWDDAEGLFNPGKDYLVASTTVEMKKKIRDVLNDDELALALMRNGRETILRRHTCAHRVDELMSILDELDPAPASVASSERPTLRRTRSRQYRGIRNRTWNRL